MADGDLVHQPAFGTSRLDIGPKRYDLPLLPFEKQLIELLGCSENDYRFLVTEAIRRGGVRPAEYAHIPDVQMDALTIAIISLVIGLASSAVGFLLAPKPQPLGRQVTQRNLASITGANRFAPTFGFDSQAELANYGDPIPIVFGRYTGSTGGMVVSPSLVWSRMLSYGTQQAVKMLFVVGEQGYDAKQNPFGIEPPSLNGIFIGNGPLDAIYENAFTFYWKRGTRGTDTRIKASNKLYGTRGNRQDADPEVNDDIFSCPTGVSNTDTGFCSAHSLTNNNQIGCYAPIANGTPYRTNWRVISIIGTDSGNNLLYERIKISGNKNDTLKTPAEVRALYQEGTGRNYSRRMGITSLNGVTVSDAVGFEEKRVAKNDVIQFTISSAQIDENIYEAGSVKIEDINSELNEQRTAADDALQIGELFMIGRTMWQVTDRALDQWRAEDKKDQVVTLKCIDVIGKPLIGIVSRAMLTAQYLSDDEGATNKLHVGTAFYPLMRFSKGMVRNTRICEVTEIGLRSSVYQRVNGLCNFQSIPTPGELKEAQAKSVNLNTGSITAFLRRASVFVIYVRPAGLDPNGAEYTWEPLGLRFAVVGNQPTDLYNYIRIKHPRAGQYEFQFIPKNGADMRNANDGVNFWKINAAATKEGTQEPAILSQVCKIPYGDFVVTSIGKEVTQPELRYNNEFTSKPSTVKPPTDPAPKPSVVGINNYIPDADGTATRATAITTIQYESDPAGFTLGRSLSLAYEIFKDYNLNSYPEGATITKVIRESSTTGATLATNQWIDIEYTAVKTRLAAGHYSGQQFAWSFPTVFVKVINSDDGFNLNQEFSIFKATTAANPFRVVPGQGTLTKAGVRMRVTAVSTLTLTQGVTQTTLEEAFGPARDYDLGYTKTITLSITVSVFKKIQLNLTSKVEALSNAPIVGPISTANHWSGQTKKWSDPVIEVDRDTFTTSGWSLGDTFEKTYAVGASNPFGQTYRKNNQSVGFNFRVNYITKAEAGPPTFNAARQFETESQYSDITYYGNLIEKSNNSQPEHQIAYVNELISNKYTPNYDNMTICGLVLKASRNFSTLDQIRMWLPSGVHVTRFHPDDTGVGPSNLLCDLVFYLLTNNTAGLGGVLNMDANNAPLVNTADLPHTARFLKQNKLFYDGILGTPTNLREFVSQTAPYFLCNFVISNGKFSLVPALPTTAAGTISLDKVTISQLFTAGNILEDSFELEYLGAEERKPFQAIMRYRQETKNQLPEERNIVVRWSDLGEDLPVESFDMTEFCTSDAHARLVGKFFLSIRRRVTHTVRFRTTPYGLNLAPGDYIKVVTESNPYSAARNGTINASGAITSATTLTDGQYNILYYKTGADDVASATLTVSGGKAAEQSLWDTIFTIIESTTSENIYMVEQLTLADDNTVQIVASEFPCDSNLVSLIAKDITSEGIFI